MSGFTQGPWTVEPRKTSLSIVANGYCVATIRYAYNPANGYEERNANARLIAAAPELYEALEKALPALASLALEEKRRNKRLPADLTKNTAQGRHNAAVAALAKARGEQ